MAPKQEVAILPHKEEEEEEEINLTLDSGELQLPMGFHFGPTDDVLIVHFLIPKILGRQLPPHTMEDFDDVYTSDPKQILFSKFEDELDKYMFSKHMFMVGSAGHWKEIKDDVEVRNESNEILGYKKTLIYNEYRVSPNFMMIPADDAKKYVACRLKFKKTTNHFKIEECTDHSSSTDAGDEDERETSMDQPRKKMRPSI